MRDLESHLNYQVCYYTHIKVVLQKIVTPKHHSILEHPLQNQLLYYGFQTCCAHNLFA